MRDHFHRFLIGPTDTGKTWPARAIFEKACRDGHSALFLKASELFRGLSLARADGSHEKVPFLIGRVDVLIVDDFCMAPMGVAERRDFLEICDGLNQTHWRLLTSQLPGAS